MDDKPSGSAIEKKIVICNQDAIHIIRHERIVKCESENNYTHVYLENGQKLTLCKTLKTVEKLLNSERFTRISQSCVINIDYIRSINKKGKTVVLANEQKAYYTVTLKFLLDVITGIKSEENAKRI